MQPDGLRNVDLGLAAFLAQRSQPCAYLCQTPRINVHMATINDGMQTIVIARCSRLGGIAAVVAATAGRAVAIAMPCPAQEA